MGGGGRVWREGGIGWEREGGIGRVGGGGGDRVWREGERVGREVG